MGSGPLEPTPPSLPELVLHIFSQLLFKGLLLQDGSLKLVRVFTPWKLANATNLRFPFWTAICKTFTSPCCVAVPETLSPLVWMLIPEILQAMGHLPPLLLALLWECRHHLAPLQSCGPLDGRPSSSLGREGGRRTPSLLPLYSLSHHNMNTQAAKPQAKFLY